MRPTGILVPSLCEEPPSFPSTHYLGTVHSTYPPPAAAEFSRRAGPLLPFTPSFPWNLLGYGPGPGTWTCSGAGRDPQPADLGHSHPRIKKAAPALPRIILQSWSLDLLAFPLSSLQVVLKLAQSPIAASQPQASETETDRQTERERAPPQAPSGPLPPSTEFPTNPPISAQSKPSATAANPRPPLLS